jgi:hypothetical protein
MEMTWTGGLEPEAISVDDADWFAGSGASIRPGWPDGSTISDP